MKLILLQKFANYFVYVNTLWWNFDIEHKFNSPAIILHDIRKLLV